MSADDIVRIASAIRIGDVEMTRSIVAKAGCAVEEWQSHADIVRRGVERLAELYRSDGSGEDVVYELTLMAASLAPALRSACRAELQQLAAAIPGDELEPLLDAPSPHVRIGARLLMGWMLDPPAAEPARRSREVSFVPTTEDDVRSADLWGPDGPAVGEEPPPSAASVDRTLVLDEHQSILADLCHPDEAVRRRAIGRCRDITLTSSLADALIGAAQLDSSAEGGIEAIRAFVGQPQTMRLRAAECALRCAHLGPEIAVELLTGRSEDEIARLVEVVERPDMPAATRAVELLAQLPPSEAMALLWASLPRVTTGTQQAIVDRLCEIDAKALSFSVRLGLRDGGGADQRTASLIALGFLSDEPIAPLLDHLTDRDVQARRAALTSLARREESEALEGIGGRLSDPRPEIRVLAIAVLREKYGAEAAFWLIPAAGDPVETVRSAAIEAIRSLGSSEVIDKVLVALRSPATERLASQLLVELGGLATGSMIAAVRGAPPRTVELIGEILRKTSAAPTIAKQLLDRDPQRRADAAEAAAAMRAPGVGDTLLELMDDPEPDVRCRAAELLGRTGDTTVVDRLSNVRAQEPDARVAAAIESSLARLSNQSDGAGELRAVDVERRAS